ncbi:TonB-dependent receptor plug domain-containing protein [Hoylesella enoeca]|uniref:TonB-dependent receptor n=1 Tax=Hoylesella enoeca TaxID=76123 RepID=A0A0S2KJ19_9BACT|nr:TonB-dependent receptor [Hoylesella enoeca]ALO48295.1 TonB-dependent receptor [Hoylesella enoeca]
MKKNSFNKRSIIRFKHFSRKGYALFNCLGREVVVGTLSIATLTYAKADSAAVRSMMAADSLNRQELKLDEVVVTGSRAPLTALQSAKVVAVITREDIHRAAAASINDVMKLATGVDVRQRGGFGVQTDISINGGTHDQVTILLNGVNISNPQTGHNAADFPVSLEDIERIEVLEGASARIFGSSAFSGAINIVTRSKIDGDRLRGSGEGGSFGTFGGSVGYEMGYLNVGHLLASGGYTRSDGGTPHSDFEKGHFYTNFQLGKIDLFRLNFQLGLNTQRYGANTFYSPRFDNQFEKTAHLITSTSLTLHNLVKGLDIVAGGSFNRFKDHFQLIRGREGAANGENYHRLNVYGGMLNANMAWTLGKTAIGIDYSHEQLLSTAYGEELAPDDYRHISGSDRQYTRKGRRDNTNLFLEHNVVLDRWTFSAGLLANRHTGLDHRFRFSPGIDIAYRPDDHWKIFASWNQAMRIPTYTDLYTDNKAQKGDKNLKPERNSTFKLGARYRTTGLETTVNSFYSRGQNMIDWVFENATATRYHALNIGKLDNMGASIDASVYVTEISSHSFLTRIKAGYAYIHQTHETSQPIFKSLYALEYLRHKVTLTVDHRIWSHLSANWALRWQQRMNGYHPYTKIDCKVQWDVPTYNLYIRADNLTAHRYYDIGGVKQPGLWLMVGGAIKLELN